MALAILTFEDAGPDTLRFRIDTGTNSYYRIRIGRSIVERSGLKWVSDELYATELRRKRGATDFFDTSEEAILPAAYFREACYVQLFTCKDPNGRAPAVSRVLKFNAINTRSMQDFETAAPYSANRTFNRPRSMALSYDKYSTQASWTAILGPILQAAVPVAVNMLMGANGSAAGGPAVPAAASQQGALTSLLQAVVSAISGNTAGTPALSGAHSMNGNGKYSKAFIAGIDDALIMALAPVIASVAGPILQQGISALPQLLGAVTAHQQQDSAHRLNTLRANQQLMATLAGDINRRLMLQQILDRAPAAGSTLTPEQISQLTQLLQQPQPPAAPAVAQSFSFGGNATAVALSNSVIVTFDTAPELAWNNTNSHIYRRDVPVTLSVRLNVNPAPQTPLPKAIFKVCFKDAQDQKVVFEKLFRQKNVAANTNIDLAFTREELAAIPAQRPLMIFTEVRWVSGKTGKQYKAAGSMNAVFVNEYWFKSRGTPLQEEKELTDMNVYRVFWNKVWEAPVLNQSGSGKSLWELDVTGKYLFGIDITEGSNAIMETKTLSQPDDPDSLTQKTAGKMKAGMELSVDELNKLCSLWPGGQPLAPEQLEALKTDAFARDNAVHMTFTIRMKGRARERGMVWVVPTFKAFELLLQKTDSANEKGQVVQTSEHKLLFPLPVNTRLLGLKSNNY